MPEHRRARFGCRTERRAESVGSRPQRAISRRTFRNKRICQKQGNRLGLFPCFLYPENPAIVLIRTFSEHGRGELCSPAGDRRSPLLSCNILNFISEPFSYGKSTILRSRSLRHCVARFCSMRHASLRKTSTMPRRVILSLSNFWGKPQKHEA